MNLTNRHRIEFTPEGGPSHGRLGFGCKQDGIRCERCFRSCRDAGLPASANPRGRAAKCARRGRSQARPRTERALARRVPVGTTFGQLNERNRASEFELIWHLPGEAGLPRIRDWNEPKSIRRCHAGRRCCLWLTPVTVSSGREEKRRR
jgi:hypothetical protein